jgi:hypothetical protein
MNPISTDIFGRLQWLTDKIKRLFGSVTSLDERVTAIENGGGGGSEGGGGTSVNFQVIDLSAADYTVSIPGVYDIINPDGGYEIIITCNPSDNNGKTITFINKGGSTAPISSSEWVPYYQGNIAATPVNGINAGSVLEIVAVFDAAYDNAWRTKPTTFVQTKDNVVLTDGVDSFNLFVAVNGGGFYIIDVANDAMSFGGVVAFPSPASYEGQRVVIINRDPTYNATIDSSGSIPVELDGTTLSIIPASSTNEFIATTDNWYLLTQRII